VRRVMMMKLSGYRNLVIIALVAMAALGVVSDIAFATTATDTEFANLKTDSKKLTTGNLIGSIAAIYIIGDVLVVGFGKKDWIAVIISIVIGLGILGAIWYFIESRFTMVI
jgi:hypothetical protein